MLRVQEKHKESLESQEELLNEMEAVNRMTEREKKAEEEKRKMRERELHTQVNILSVGIYLQCQKHSGYSKSAAGLLPGSHC